MEKTFTKKDFGLPDPITVRCPRCHEEIDECDICGLVFKTDYEVACGFHNHICESCWLALPEGE